jgi:hypothetical protein
MKHEPALDFWHGDPLKSVLRNTSNRRAMLAPFLSLRLSTRSLSQVRNANRKRPMRALWQAGPSRSEVLHQLRQDRHPCQV